MKKILFAISFFMTLSTASYANKIVIIGNPVILEKQGNFYYLPNRYTITTSYYYVILDGVRQVCYIDKQPALSALNTKHIDVNYKGSTMTWICYPYDNNYFETP
ncbi:hypothetical protein [Legionella cincinnatiensis]|uniref:Secreted protein n=1 Tax=Legionella cincinnatiensis TaxID=28085 RepID=A0A378IH49_9GAMM|nr:hypothetical protein [Legionella cincinnatiensis]KTC91768.1 hypothetical protein Lcin_1168 [Legionella cincinnatiensis]STX34529.1 Uncharacterised protein [Legionella cincinnatiensis]